MAQAPARLDPFKEAERLVNDWHKYTGHPIQYLLGADPKYASKIVLDFVAYVIDPTKAITVTPWRDPAITLDGYIAFLYRTEVLKYQIAINTTLLRSRRILHLLPDLRRVLMAPQVLQEIIEASNRSANPQGYFGEILQARLYLHEAGHMALHKERIFPSMLPGKRRPNLPEPEQEAEAWQFSFAVTALALADAARNSPGGDQNWLYI